MSPFLSYFSCLEKSCYIANKQSRNTLWRYIFPSQQKETNVKACVLFRIIDNVRGELQKRQWIIFDGDVDPEWVENLNSVLDDNKLLTLPNGERLSLPPNVRKHLNSSTVIFLLRVHLCDDDDDDISAVITQVRIMFEVQDLKYATLATVSRCGMVWFSEDVLSTDMIFNNFLARLRSIPLDEGEDEAQRMRKSTEDESEESASPMLQVCQNCSVEKNVIIDTSSLEHII